MRYILLLCLCSNCYAGSNIESTIFRALMSYENNKKLKSGVEREAKALVKDKGLSLILGASLKYSIKEELRFKVRIKGYRTDWTIKKHECRVSVVWEF